jgi:hypothetical protein
VAQVTAKIGSINKTNVPRAGRLWFMGRTAKPNRQGPATRRIRGMVAISC